MSIIFFGAANASPQAVSEYAVKAAFVYDFAKFVSWPPGAFKDTNSPITICVLGENPFTNSLSQIIAGKTFNGRRFAVKYRVEAQAAKGCQIIFISRSEQKQLRDLLPDLRNAGALTIGDTNGFAKQGVMINLFMEGNKVRFAINPGAARSAGIRISSKLLSLAKIVSD
ncbi:MAG: YfiR family protein [Terriglobia bacterium]